MGKFVPLKYYKVIQENTSAGIPHQEDIINSWISSVISYIDNQIDQLKKEILSGKTDKTKKSYFNRLKNWWYNATMGKKNKRNPFYFQNYLGKLGQVAEMHLDDYQFIMNESVILEDLTNRPKLHLDNLIDSWADRFKNDLTERLKKLFTKAINTPMPKPEIEPVKYQNHAKPIHEPEFTDEEEVDLTEKPSSISEIVNILKKLSSEEIEDEEYFVHMFQNRFMEKAKNDPKIAEEILKELKDYMDNRLPENLNLLLSKLTKKYGSPVRMAEAFFGDFFLPKTELDFDNTTLYDRTIECLDKLREIKK